jgi:hypothetical protein
MLLLLVTVLAEVADYTGDNQWRSIALIDPVGVVISRTRQGSCPCRDAMVNTASDMLQNRVDPAWLRRERSLTDCSALNLSVQMPPGAPLYSGRLPYFVL